MFAGRLLSLALFSYTATGGSAFTVTAPKKELLINQYQSADFPCQYSADFGTNTRIEWKFKNLEGSQMYVIFKSEITEPYRGRVKLLGSTLRLSNVTVKDNGFYDCEVSGNDHFGEVQMTLTVLVPPGVPVCKVPSSVTTGNPAILSCKDNVGSPPPTYTWFRNGVVLPTDPKTVSAFKNATYKINPKNGNLEFGKTLKTDTASYYCVAENGYGSAQQCKAAKMEVRDLNTGGIVAGVIIFLLLLALLGFGIWYAYKKGYIPKQSDKQKTNVVYQPPSVYGGGEDDDGDFKQKSSFVV